MVRTKNKEEKTKRVDVISHLISDLINAKMK